MEQLVVILIGALVAAVLVYLTVIIWAAKTSVDQAPRAPMFICPKHGPLMERYTLKLDVASGKPIDYCSICFHEKMKEARR
jgi:hypothetical protein